MSVVFSVVFRFVVVMVLCVLSGYNVFFFQAEDGIRDLVRSRGLGDVYKRQEQADVVVEANEAEADAVRRAVEADEDRVGNRVHPVSYTHLTLPTSDLV